MALVFDFDGTITQEDTIGELAQAAIGHQRTKTGRDLSASWDQVVKAYMDDRAAFKSGYPIKEEDRRTFEEEIDFMNAMKAVELASLDRVFQSGLFKEMGPNTLFQLGSEARRSGKIKIREGFEEIYNWAEDRDLGIAIVSVNWSADFIRGALCEFPLTNIVSNHVNYTGLIHGPPALAKPLTSAIDKVEGVLEALGSMIDKPNVCLYFGDSTTDLACLLPNTGIVICNDDQQSQLLSTLERLQRNCPHISNFKTCDANQELFWARDFREVMGSGVLGKVKTSSTQRPPPSEIPI